jgi:hypothetical protein
VNLAELAKLRWLEGWSRVRLAGHFQKTSYAIAKYCVAVKKKGFEVDGLSSSEKEQIKTLASKSYKNNA